MSARQLKSRAGFTLVELLVGMSLSLIVMAGVLSTFNFLGRNLVRLANQQKLESESRRTLGYFAQDLRMATALGSPNASAVTLTIPTSSGTTTVLYTYHTTATTIGGVSIPAGSLSRRAPAGGTPVILLNDIVSSGFAFAYYDRNDNAVTDFPEKVLSIRKVSMSFSTQRGDSANGTRTRVHQAASPRLAFRNKPMLQ